MRNLGESRVLARRVGRARFADEVELRVGHVKRIPNERRQHILKKSEERMEFKGRVPDRQEVPRYLTREIVGGICASPYVLPSIKRSFRADDTP